MSIQKKAEETAVLKKQFVELTATGILESEGHEQFGNLFSSRGAEDAGTLSVTTGGTAGVAFAVLRTCTTEPERGTGPAVELQSKLAAYRQEWP